ncbi:sulfite exporter TauE/SafE family protein [Azospirillum brasilense]|uniref:sulfite exporter TauE/SafE family protein n=1 Tax=Azospirillum brasilense TaxID=192 RepID=UPI000E69D767|nr:sulfite exporter TauE/SafE family protein [Azospirillum brasilense]NUB26433.1 sulfite exporter TauE/SafE family protein [Azospirillum brasilense]NUB31890.1 sulfite exporter TauE/SafE family protein [Azospirillum brasilense]RIW03890.1 sulfite exporter TauE/SafE family protein [Azospirillum brasilense]
MDAHSALTLLDAGLNQCAVVIDRDGGLLVALLTAGLVGGSTHCAGMCGPFVLAQVTARLEQVPASRMSELHRLAGAAVLPYHLGRGTTYTLIGAAAAAVAGHVGALPGLKWLSVALLAFAALFFLGYAVKGLTAWMPKLDGAVQRWWGDRVSRLARPLFGNPTGWRGYGLGLALGFIPCGLLYGAVAVAAASGSALTGALGMAAFALGTLPSLLAVGLAGHLAGRTWRSAVARAAPVIMVVNAGVLGWMAVRMIG